MTAPTIEAPAPEQPIDAGPPPSAGVPFTIPVMVLEGYRTSDDRQIRPGALSHRALPLSLMVLDETSPYGHDGAQLGGRIETLERVDASSLTDPVTGEAYGAGVFAWKATGTFIDSDEGRSYAQRAAEQSLRGVSVDLAVTEYEETVLEEDADGFPTRVLFEVLAGEIMGSTVCPFPAFAGAYIVVDPTAAGVGSEQTSEAEASADGEAVAASASGLPWLNITDAEPCGTCPDGTLVAAGTIPDDAPPAEWFTDPKLTEPTPVQVDLDGRVYGHIAAWGTCHTGSPGRCIPPPKSPTEYAWFNTRSVLCADGTFAPVGPLTVGTNHAPLSMSADEARDYYAHTGQCAARVRAGEDEHGIWVAGYVPPGTDPQVVATLRAHPPSGDWRPVGGQLDMLGVLAVNVAGFPIKARARVASGRPTALVAAGSAAVVAAAEKREVEAVPAWVRPVLDELAVARRERDADRALARIQRRR